MTINFITICLNLYQGIDSVSRNGLRSTVESQCWAIAGCWHSSAVSSISTPQHRRPYLSLFSRGRRNSKRNLCMLLRVTPRGWRRCSRHTLNPRSPLATSRSCSCRMSWVVMISSSMPNPSPIFRRLWRRRKTHSSLQVTFCFGIDVIHTLFVQILAISPIFLDVSQGLYLRYRTRSFVKFICQNLH